MAEGGLGGFVISALVITAIMLFALWLFFDVLGFTSSSTTATGAGSAH